MGGLIGALRHFEQYFSHIRTTKERPGRPFCNKATLRFEMNFAFSGTGTRDPKILRRKKC